MRDVRAWRLACVASLLAAVGCGGAVAPGTEAGVGPAVAGERTVLATSPEGFEAVLAGLPERIAAADAERVLVSLDAAAIGSGGYGVLNRRHDRIWDRRRERDRRRFLRRGHTSFFGSRFRNFRYYPVGSYYLPYYRYGSYYYPYRSIYDTRDLFDYVYSPFYYLSRGSYLPYTFYSRYDGGLAVDNAVVNIQDLAFQPATIRLKRNGSVTFKNLDRVVHTATGYNDTDPWDTGDILPGQSSEAFTFVEPGTYRFDCRYHPSMTGTIIVE